MNKNLLEELKNDIENSISMLNKKKYNDCNIILKNSLDKISDELKNENKDSKFTFWGNLTDPASSLKAIDEMIKIEKEKISKKTKTSTNKEDAIINN